MAGRVNQNLPEKMPNIEQRRERVLSHALCTLSSKWILLCVIMWSPSIDPFFARLSGEPHLSRFWPSIVLLPSQLKFWLLHLDLCALEYFA